MNLRTLAIAAMIGMGLLNAGSNVAFNLVLLKPLGLAGLAGASVTLLHGGITFSSGTMMGLAGLMAAILGGVAQGYSRAVGEYGSVVMISSNVPFRDLITPTLIIQKLEEYDFEAATVIGSVMLIFSLFSLLVINLLQVWGQRYQGDSA
jgi:ABC-type sulfate transport system permease component